ncbi:hypothetical protein [Acinetobacter nematophilus]|uniref:DUF2057 domain-containing protein n=1 Tax=Acinetobacter nematophilus TaxID=2994642 RepID=A0A9X3DSP3_9GAMM|nr:hypothetical protein [Acinetobacter nematophilus]MCX5467112.1 hypothetical protein [Acinetobacter nematophilus]
MSKIIASSILLMFSCAAFANDYSNITLEVLGYDLNTNHIYVVENSKSYSIPKVYYYSLNEKKYDLPKYDERFTAINDQVKFEQTLAKIQPQLKPLKALDLGNFKLNLVEQKQSSQQDSTPLTSVYSSIFTVQDSQNQSKVMNLTSYSPDIKLKQAFELPRNQGALITFESLSLPFDEGYTREEAIILFPNRQLPQ